MSRRNSTGDPHRRIPTTCVGTIHTILTRGPSLSCTAGSSGTRNSSTPRSRRSSGSRNSSSPRSRRAGRARTSNPQKEGRLDLSILQNSSCRGSDDGPLRRVVREACHLKNAGCHTIRDGKTHRTLGKIGSQIRKPKTGIRSIRIRRTHDQRRSISRIDLDRSGRRTRITCGHHLTTCIAH